MIQILSQFYKFLWLSGFLLLVSLALRGQEKQKLPRTVHVLVALCDNESQGIAPVPPLIGNGNDPYNNLYWGCGYGIKTFFGRSQNWQLIQSQKFKSYEATLLERLIFKHRQQNAYLIADAYRGNQIKQTLNDFLDASAGVSGTYLHTPDGQTLGIGGHADLIAYIGHNGLMEWNLPTIRRTNIYKKRAAIVLACLSDRYFRERLLLTDTYPLLLTTDLMAPEAYTLEAVLHEWLSDGHNPESIHRAAAEAYQKYQKCSPQKAQDLFRSGW
ncbi:MAG: hypothetical protein ACFCUI_04120 [Bernardetiaceae bacterium]